MKLGWTIGLFCCWLLASQNSVRAAAIDRAFTALSNYNYFEAKRLFQKLQKKEPSAANYGLAVIYFRKDNPFHNLDSAFSTIVRSENAYSLVTEKSKKRLKVYGFDYLAIVSVRNDVSTACFERILKSPGVEKLNDFIERHPWAGERLQSVHMRDSIAYFTAVEAATSTAYFEFMSRYPESEYYPSALNEYLHFQFKEQTVAGTIAAYLLFEKRFPDSPYVAEAQDNVYRISTARNTRETFDQFLENYPKNRNRDAAWRRLYQLYMYDYSPERVDAFLADYPGYPFQEEVLRDQALAVSQIIPYSEGSSFGWMNLDGKPVIKAEYASVGFFREGLAWAEKKGKYGFVNKMNEVVIDFRFDGVNDFERGRAIVQIGEGYGIIDRSGSIIVEPIYNDLGQFSEGLIYARKDSLYGYLDSLGYARIPMQFDEAFSFSGGRAKVKAKGFEYFIDAYATLLVPPVYEQVDFFTDTLLTFTEKELKGIMNRRGQVIVPAVYDHVGELVNGRALVIRDEFAGYIDATGREIIPAVYDSYASLTQEGDFSGDYVRVRKAGKYGVIDRSGKVIIPFQYDHLGRASSLIAYEKKGKWGYMNVSGKAIILPVYELAESFSYGLGLVRTEAGFGAVDTTGKAIIPAQYASLKRLDASHYIVSDGGKYSVFSTSGQLLAPIQYQQIRKIQDDLLLLVYPGGVNYLRLSDNRIIKPKTANG